MSARGHTFSLRPFLGEPVPVEFADRLVAFTLDGATVTLTCATARHEPQVAGYYGTDIELVLEEPVPGRPATLVADFWSPSVIRFRYAPGETVPTSPVPDGLGPAGALSPMVTGRPDPDVRLTVGETAEAVTITSDALEMRVVRDPFQMQVRDLTGLVLWSTKAPDIEPLRRPQPQWRPAQQRWTVRHRYGYPLGLTVDTPEPRAFLSVDLHHDEHIVGFGQTFGRLDRTGTSQELWVQEGIGNSSPASYIRAPFHVSNRGHGMFMHTSNMVTAHVGSIDHSALSMVVDGAESLDWFVISGTPSEVLGRYASISGAAALPPAWTFGLWMSRLTYSSQVEVADVAHELRRRRIPADVIHIDTGWFEHSGLCDLKFAPDRFPDPSGMVSSMRELGIRVSVWQWPTYSVDNPLFSEAMAAGHLVKRASGYTLTFEGGWGEDAGLLDFSNPDAVAWYQGKLRDVLGLGIAAIKVDFGEGAPPDARYARVAGRSMHNLYPLLYQQAVWDVTAEVKGATDAVIWARSGWAGSQRYPVHWSGDSVSRFEDLPGVVRSMLSMAMSGFPFYSHDVGGFFGIPSPELYVRWMQLGAFSSHVRAHGVPPREPWAFGDDAESMVRQIVELRYRLLPYLWTAARIASETGLPVVRPLLLAWPDDPIAWQVDDEYLFGPDILVAPVMDEGATSRAVYLPAGTWWDFWSGAAVAGGRYVTAAAPLDRIPLFIRDGAMIPMGPLVQHVDERPTDPLELHFWGTITTGRSRISLAAAQTAEVTWTSEHGDVQVEVEGVTSTVDVYRHDQQGTHRMAQ